MQHPDYPHGAQVTWGRPYDTITAWDEISTWGIEFFGLPGDRYVTDININEMVWWFLDGTCVSCGNLVTVPCPADAE